MRMDLGSAGGCEAGWGGDTGREGGRETARAGAKQRWAAAAAPAGDDRPNGPPSTGVGAPCVPLPVRPGGRRGGRASAPGGMQRAAREWLRRAPSHRAVLCLCALFIAGRGGGGPGPGWGLSRARSERAQSWAQAGKHYSLGTRILRACRPAGARGATGRLQPGPSTAALRAAGRRPWGPEGLEGDGPMGCKELL